MKQAFLLLALLSSFFGNAQSLKEALFSGKLKNEPGTVIRKGDDLSTKIDTTTRKAPAKDTLAVITVALPKATDSAQNKLESSATANNTASSTSTATEPVAATTETTVSTEMADTTATAAEPEAKAKPISNRTLFKEYMNSLIATLKADVLPNKKIKKGSYYVTFGYTIGTDGEVTITDLLVDPKQELLQQQIKERMELDLPKLQPEVNSSGVARKVNRRYSFTLDKE